MSVWVLLHPFQLLLLSAFNFSRSRAYCPVISSLCSLVSRADEQLFMCQLSEFIREMESICWSLSSVFSWCDSIFNIFQFLSPPPTPTPGRDQAQGLKHVGQMLYHGALSLALTYKLFVNLDRIHLSVMCSINFNRDFFCLTASSKKLSL